MGKTWEGSEAELKVLRTDLDGVAAWGRDHKRPVYVGEFGSYQKADMASRLRWTQAIQHECELRFLPWAYWEFAAGFGIYDPEKREWRQPLLKALIP